jgi:heme-degrading monooxygenase HmoA
MEANMIARVWRGVTPQKRSDEYLDYLKKTGVRDCKSTDGNLGVYVMRRALNGNTEFLFISLWDSMDSIRKFAGPAPERAVYYPEDAEFLLEMTPEVEHYEVAVQPD